MAAPLGLTGAPAGQTLVGAGVGAAAGGLPHPSGVLGGNNPGDFAHAPNLNGTEPRFPSAHTMNMPATGGGGGLLPSTNPSPNRNPGLPAAHTMSSPAPATTVGAGSPGSTGPGSTFPKATTQTTPGPAPAPPPPLAPPGTSPGSQPFLPSGSSDSPVPPGTPQITPGGFTNPSTGQTSPAVGTPTGYDVGQGIDTSVQNFMPTGVDANSFEGIPLSETKGPSAQTYINSVEGQAQGPTDWNVTPDQTVAGQYSQLMAKGNPAIQAAEESAIRANAASGGRNSLMAQNAATLAGSQVALSIASQDAQTYAAAGKYNADAANTFATNMNNFVESMTANQQSFDLGYAQLANQFNVNMATMYGQVIQGAAAASENVKQTIADTQASTNATLEQMDKTFSQNVAETEMNQQFTNENAWTNYGMQVRASYLSSINQQQTALMQTIAAINSNPNINATQAAAGIQSAVSQFNAFMTMNNAYYQSMVPNSDTATYQAYNPEGWPDN